MADDLLWRHLKDLPYFRALLRAVEARFYQDIDLAEPILDLGCGDGHFASIALDGRTPMVGVDPWWSPLTKTVKRQVYRYAIQSVGGALPFASQYFSTVISNSVLEHIPELDPVLAEVNRVLKPGGTLILTYPNIRTALGIAMMLFYDIPPMYAARYRSPHYRDFTLRTIKMVLNNHGFTASKAIGSAFYLPKIEEYWSWLATYFPSWSHTVIVAATKTRDSKYSAEDARPSALY